jgi:hypothetical protein
MSLLGVLAVHDRSSMTFIILASTGEMNPLNVSLISVKGKRKEKKIGASKTTTMVGAQKYR